MSEPAAAPDAMQRKAVALSKEVSQLSAALEAAKSASKAEVKQAQEEAKRVVEESTARQLKVVETLRESLISANLELHDWKNQIGPALREQLKEAKARIAQLESLN